ncbi:hypothetical protein BD309DRAFT_1031693 [Dichomitus squalens]|nr:hypothetical protein BD309DRAFT_1031693 [Dichomitus squalens]
MGTTSSFLRRSARHPSGHPCPRHSPLLRAARCALSSFRLPSGASYAVIRSLLPFQPGPPLGRIMLTPSLLLGPASLPRWIRSPSLLLGPGPRCRPPFGCNHFPLGRSSRSASRASGSPLHSPFWLELGPPVARESGGDTDSVVPRSFRSAPNTIVFRPARVQRA